MLRKAMIEVDLGTSDQRARFEAVRRRVFGEMTSIASRKRLAIVAPFQILVLTVLIVYGTPPIRIAIQGIAFGASLVGYRIIDRSDREHRIFGFLVTMLATFVSIENTGGLASPLFIGAAPFLLTFAINPDITPRQQRIFLGGFALGLVGLAVAARTPLGKLFPPLAPELMQPSGAFTTLAIVSGLMSAVAMFKIGRKFSVIYEKIALEVAIQREELCDESAGRTRALEGVAARLAHEVKNPLAAIKGLSTHVARNATDAKVAERLTIVAAEAERLQEIVDSFLSFSRGLDDLSLGPVKPYELARDLSLLLETRASDAGVSIELLGSRELTLDADGKKLRQALLNLVLNAIQASARETTVTLEVAKYIDGAAQIKIIDRGAGMSAAVLDRIRRPYFTTREGGSGLGIAIARGLIEQHGGNLQFESSEGRGTTATIMLPAAAVEKPKLPNPCRRETAANENTANEVSEPRLADLASNGAR